MNIDDQGICTGLEWLDAARRCSFVPANAVAGVIANTGTIDLPLLPDFPVDPPSNATTKLLRKPASLRRGSSRPHDA
jgi:hypothetical protein